MPNAQGSVVRYNLSPTATAAGTVTLDQAATIGIVTQLNNPGGGNNGIFKIEKSGTNALTFYNGLVTNAWGNTDASIEFVGNGNTTDQLQINPDIIIANTDLNIATFACGVKIGASANNSAITATTNQNLNLRANAGSRALTINHSIGTAGAGVITLNNIGTSGLATTIAGNLGAQVGSITQNGVNPLVLSGTNSAFTGPTTITSGILRYNAATALPAIGSGRSITVSTGGIASAGYAIDNTFLGRIVQSSTGAIALNLASANALDFTGFTSASLAATAAVTYSGTLTPNAQAYRFGGGTAKLTVSSALNDSGGASSVTKVGTDTVALSSTNGYTNGTTVSAGILQFTKAAALSNYNVSSKVSVANGATLAVNYGGAADWTSGEVDDLLSTNGAGFAAGSALAFDTTNLSGCLCLQHQRDQPWPDQAGNQHPHSRRHELLHRSHHDYRRHAQRGHHRQWRRGRKPRPGNQRRRQPRLQRRHLEIHRRQRHLRPGLHDQCGHHRHDRHHQQPVPCRSHRRGNHGDP